MGPTAEELKQEIEQKRLELGEDLTALGDHVSPAQIAQRKKAEYGFRARQGWETVQTKIHAATSTDRVAGADVEDAVDDFAHSDHSNATSLTDNPLAVGAISLVAGLLVGAVWSRRRTRRRMKRRMNRAS